MRTIVALCVLASLPAHAGGRGGHFTGPFDANLFPGATVTTINCTNNNTTDKAALQSFVTAGIAANPTLQVLRLTGTCDFSGISTSYNLTSGTNGVQNVVIWGYGANITNAIYIGGENLPQTKNSAARINTVSAGATTLQLTTNSDGTKLAVGNWIAVTGVQLQAGGNQNFQRYEYKLITGLSGCGGSTTCTVTINEPLTNAYESTWPVYQAGGPISGTVTTPIASPGVVNWPGSYLQDTQFIQFQVTGGTLPTGITASTLYYALNPTGYSPDSFQISATKDGAAINFTGTSSGTQTGTSGDWTDFGGAGTIYVMGPNWNTNHKVYGLTIVPPGVCAETNIIGRVMANYDMVYSTCFASTSTSANVTTAFYNCVLPSIEVDKTISLMVVDQCSGHLFFQSAAPATLKVNRFSGLVSGTSLNSTFTASTLGPGTGIGIGTNCYGQANSIAFDGVSISNGIQIGCFILASKLSYDGTNTFFVANLSAFNSEALYTFVPGGKYYFGWANGSSLACNAGVTFTVSDITQDATNTYYHTDLSGALPTPTCMGQAANAYAPYPAKTITQINSTGTNMTVFAPP